MLKILNFLTTIGGSIMAKLTKKYSANIQFYIDFSALKIFNKEKNIEQIFVKLRDEVLEVCKQDYNCDGYGEQLKSVEDKEV